MTLASDRNPASSAGLGDWASTLTATSRPSALSV